MSDQGPNDAVEERSAHPALRIAAPFVAIAAMWASERLLTVAYETATGKKPPTPEDPSVSFSRALVWTVVTATTSAVLHMAIQRAAAKTVPVDAGS